MTNLIDESLAELRKPGVLDLVEMYDMYAMKCTRQEEKFDYYRRNGIPWTWEDCEAAAVLLFNVYGSARWSLWDAWRRYWPQQEAA